MATFALDIVLGSDAIFTAHPATTSAETLAYIPGSALLGVAAARLYRRFEELDCAFAVFHEARVRFGPAYPVVDGEATLPVPFSWHGDKLAGPSKDGCLDADLLYNVSRMSLAELADKRSKGEQPQQVRDLFWSASGKIAGQDRRVSMKTALDPERGLRARDKHLFVYHSLPAGSRFRAVVEYDEQVLPPGARAELESSLTKGEAWFGRSRTAEYGAATLLGAPPVPPDAEPTPAGDLHLFYCLTDLAPIDANTGFPCSVPDPVDLGLSPGASFVAVSSFIRTRRYAPFNAARRSPGYERQVLAAGSVLAYERVDAVVPPARLSVGAFQGEGLGRVLCNPAFLKEKRLSFVPMVSQPVSPTVIPEPAGDPMLWLRRARQDRVALDLVSKDVDRFLRKHQRVFLDRSAPTRSQWGEIRVFARQARDLAHLRDLLFREQQRDQRGKVIEDGGYCVKGVSKERWRLAEEGSPGKTLHAFLGEDFMPAGEQAGLYLACLAQLMQRRLAKKEEDRT